MLRDRREVPHRVAQAAYDRRAGRTRPLPRREGKRTGALSAFRPLLLAGALLAGGPFPGAAAADGALAATRAEPAATQAAPAAASPAPVSFSAAFDSAAAAAGAAGFGGVLAFRDANGAIAARAFGLADRERARAHRVDETWPWASVTKQVTAALVLREVDAGRLRLDATVGELLPSFTGSTRDRVTLRHLLQHTSGLPNPESTPAAADGVPAFYRERGPGIRDAARASGYCSGAPAAAPGERFDYNNCDYLVLGAILERATGKPYAALVRDTIGTPLGLRSLRVARDGARLGGADVRAYAAGDARAPDVNVATYGAGGALVGSARDLLEFDAALIANRLVGAASTAEMWRGEPALGYAALGAWSFPASLRGCEAPVDLVERRGEVGGVRVRNVIAPALGRAFVAFTNDTRAEFGEIWQGAGLTWELASALFCGAR